MASEANTEIVIYFFAGSRLDDGDHPLNALPKGIQRTL
jgi:hypothetical protein